MATGRRGHAVAVLNGMLYVAGGRTVDGLPNSVHRYDPAANAWEEVASMRFTRKFCSAAVLNGKLYVAGGRGTDRHHLSYVECYDPSTNSWEEVAPMSTGRCGLTLLCG